MLDYRRTWLASAMRNASAMSLGPVFVGVMAWVCLQIPFDSDTDILFLLIPSAAIALVLVSGFAKHLYWDLTLRRDFRFRVTTQFVECECPTPTLGDSFKLTFPEIQEIRLELAGYDYDQLVVLDRSDHEYRVSGAHGVPVFRIFEAIHNVSPCTKITEYGRTWEPRSSPAKPDPGRASLSTGPDTVAANDATP